MEMRLPNWLAIRPRHDAVANVRAMSYEQLVEHFAKSGGGWAATPDRAEKDAVAYRCVSLIAGHFSQISLRAFDEGMDGRLTPVEGDPVLRMVNEQPSYRWTAATFWDYMVRSILLYGDGFAVMETADGRPIALRPYHPEHVDVVAQGPRNVYRVSPMLSNQPPAATGYKQAREVLHFPNLCFDGERSLSTLSAAGNALVLQAGDGRVFAGVLSVRLANRLHDFHAGQPNRRPT